jgi:hypothetical protein
MPSTRRDNAGDLLPTSKLSPLNCCRPDKTWWSWIQVGTGVHRTQIVSAYQPYHLSGCRLIGQNGLMKVRGTMAAQHEWYFGKEENFNKPQEEFSNQLVTQLRAWQDAGEEVILYRCQKTCTQAPLQKHKEEKVSWKSKPFGQLEKRHCTVTVLGMWQ